MRNPFPGCLNNSKTSPKQLQMPNVFFGTEQITCTTVFWSEPALQLCKPGWIQIQILHNNLLSWSLAFWTELWVCVGVCVCDCGHNFDDNKLHILGAPPVSARPELIKRTYESIMLFWPREETRENRGPACARHAKDSYHPSWETSC